MKRFLLVFGLGALVGAGIFSSGLTTAQADAQLVSEINGKIWNIPRYNPFTYVRPGATISSFFSRLLEQRRATTPTASGPSGTVNYIVPSQSAITSSGYNSTQGVRRIYSLLAPRSSLSYTSPVSVTAKALDVRTPAQNTNQQKEVLLVSFRHNKLRSSDYFQDSIRVNNARFRLTASNTVGIQYSDFALISEYGNFRFAANGEVTVDMDTRLAAGESRGFLFGVGVTNFAYNSLEGKTFTLELVDVNIVKEGAFESSSFRIGGQKISQTFAFRPSFPSFSTTSFEGDVSTITGRNLTAGEESTVMSLNLSANLDDMYITKMDLTETVGSSGISAGIASVEVFDAYTNEIYGNTRIIAGKASFNFTNPIEIVRGTSKQIGVRVIVAANISEVVSGTEFGFSLTPGGLTVVSASTGQELGGSMIGINGTSDTFTISGGTVSISSAVDQPPLVPFGGLQPLYRFSINNPSNRGISVGRISLSINLDGVEFNGGISANDFELWTQSRRWNDSLIQFPFVNVIGSNVVQFESLNGVYIGAGKTLDLSLSADLDNVGTNNGDTAAVRVLGDSIIQSGTLPALKLGSASFIWSDHSAVPHTSSSSDWHTGFGVDGIPTGNTIIRR